MVGPIQTGTSGNDHLTGTISNDVMGAGDGHDVLRGGLGSDVLTGGAGMHIFKYIGSVDTITDFQASDGDKLDLTRLVTIVDWNPPEREDPIPAPETLVDSYVRLIEAGGNTMVQVDVDGTSSIVVDLVELQGVAGLSLTSMLEGGNIMNGVVTMIPKKIVA